eukprot:5791734-Pyramimonas_sp.AAC.1
MFSGRARTDEGAPAQDQVFGRKHGRRARSNYYEMLGDLRNLDVPKSRVWSTRQGHLATAMARSLTDQRRSFTKWAKATWEGKAGFLHRRAKEQQ